MEPEDSLVCEVLRAHGGQLVATDGSPTRWGGNRVIDWAAQSTFEGARVAWAGTATERFSDRKGYWLRLAAGIAERHKGRLKPAPKWLQPPHISKEDWMKKLAKAWAEQVLGSECCELVQSYLNATTRPATQQAVQEPWNAFMSCLSACYDAATNDAVRSLGCCASGEPPRPPGFSAKGRQAHFQWVPEQVGSPSNPTQGEGLRKLRRRLARLYEVKRLCALNRAVPAGLLSRALPEVPAGTAPEELASLAAQALAVTKDEQLRAEHSQQQARLAQWRDRMATGTLKALGACLKSKAAATSKAVLYNSDMEAFSRRQATAMVCRHWQEVWQEVPVDVDGAVHTLVEGFGPTQNVQWTTITHEEVLWCVRHCKGAAGADQWSGDELRFMPEPAVKLLHQLMMLWERTGLLPEQLCEARQVTLVKPGKLEPNNRLHVKNTRPITVCSCFWRIYADRMKPAISSQFLTAIGLPPHLGQLIGQAWGGQRPFVQYEGRTHAAGSATPQGCPLSTLRVESLGLFRCAHG